MSLAKPAYADFSPLPKPPATWRWASSRATFQPAKGESTHIGVPAYPLTGIRHSPTTRGAAATDERNAPREELTY